VLDVALHKNALKGCRKTLSESFDEAQDERRAFEIIEDFPFMQVLEAFRTVFGTL
jgi:hypothetical protein